MPREIWTLHRRPEVASAIRAVHLEQFFRLPPWGTNYMRSHELMSAIQYDGKAMLTDNDGSKVEVLITKEIVNKALQLQPGTYDLIPKTKAIDDEKAFVKVKGSKFKYSNLIHIELELSLWLISQHFRVQKPPSLENEEEDEGDDDEEEPIEGTSRQDPNFDNDNKDDPLSGLGPSSRGATTKPTNPSNSQSKPAPKAPRGIEILSITNKFPSIVDKWGMTGTKEKVDVDPEEAPPALNKPNLKLQRVNDMTTVNTDNIFLRYYKYNGGEHAMYYSCEEPLLRELANEKKLYVFTYEEDAKTKLIMTDKYDRSYVNVDPKELVGYTYFGGPLPNYFTPPKPEPFVRHTESMGYPIFLDARPVFPKVRPMGSLGKTTHLRSGTYSRDTHAREAMFHGGTTLTWFQPLDPICFPNIDNVLREFAEEFSKRGIKHNTVSQIYAFKQRENEKVKEASLRFKQYIERCPKRELLQDERLSMLFMEGLKNEMLNKDLHLKDCSTFKQDTRKALYIVDNCKAYGEVTEDADSVASGDSSMKSEPTTKKDAPAMPTIEQMIEEIIKRIQQQMRNSAMRQPQMRKCDICGGGYPTPRCTEQSKAPVVNGRVLKWCAIEQKWINHGIDECFYNKNYVRERPYGPPAGPPQPPPPRYQVGPNANAVAGADRPEPVLGQQPQFPHENRSMIRYAQPYEAPQPMSNAPMITYYEEPSEPYITEPEPPMYTDEPYQPWGINEGIEPPSYVAQTSRDEYLVDERTLIKEHLNGIAAKSRAGYCNNNNIRQYHHEHPHSIARGAANREAPETATYLWFYDPDCPTQGKSEAARVGTGPSKAELEIQQQNKALSIEKEAMGSLASTSQISQAETHVHVQLSPMPNRPDIPSTSQHDEELQGPALGTLD
ncbi:hypothetical protein L7F22_025024 [Adiantum nelumboides]|nr:hypothetical protein [Adiantum nelumboides]